MEIKKYKTARGEEKEIWYFSNEDLVETYNDPSTDETTKQMCLDRIIERFTTNCCPRQGEGTDELMARNISDYVNRSPKNFEKCAEQMANEHRYLQGEMFDLCIKFIKKLALNYDSSNYDGRNQYACEKSKEICEKIAYI